MIICVENATHLGLFIQKNYIPLPEIMH